MDKRSQSDESRMTRQQYRQQAANTQDELIHRRSQQGVEPEMESRTAQKIESEQLTSEEKMNRLKKRLNVVIGCVVVAIVIVYLILFLVK